MPLSSIKNADQMERSSLCSEDVAQSAEPGCGDIGREEEEPDKNSSY